MKKLLLVLMVVALASFLFVGCVPTVVDDGDDVVDDGTVVVSACPTVSVTTEVEISSKKYIKGGSQTITVTFAEATDPVSVFVGETIKANPTGVPDKAEEVVMYADADKKVYTGKYKFGASDCSEGYIYIATCVTCAPCKVAYTVDEAGPCSQVEIREYPETGCSCGGINLQFRTPVAASSCDTYGCCGDYCTGLDTYKFDLYKADPFGSCCDVPCLSPIASCEGTGCDLDCTISCFDISDYYTTTTAEDFYLVTTLADKVGNKTYYYAILNIDTDDLVSVTEYIDDNDAGSCTTWTTEIEQVDDIIGACAVGGTGVCGTVSVPL